MLWLLIRINYYAHQIQCIFSVIVIVPLYQANNTYRSWTQTHFYILTQIRNTNTNGRTDGLTSEIGNGDMDRQTNRQTEEPDITGQQ